MTHRRPEGPGRCPPPGRVQAMPTPAHRHPDPIPRLVGESHAWTVLQLPSALWCPGSVGPLVHRGQRCIE